MRRIINHAMLSSIELSADTVADQSQKFEGQRY